MTWNDTDVPLAYLITFRSYGTWLHGDERGSVNRFTNEYKSARLPHVAKWIETNTQRMKGEPVILNPDQRRCVEEGVHETCSIRKWNLQAISVRTNHVHVVVGARAKPGIVLNALKANATRKMRENGCWKNSRTPWVDKGSNRYLWNEKSVARAIDYVLYGQGDELPDFDDE
jgi:REP element-mobilizing transposase RayT